MNLQRNQPTLRPERCALLLLDYQVGTGAAAESLQGGNFGQILDLARVAIEQELPILLSSLTPEGPAGPPVPQLVELCSEIDVICRDSFSIWEHRGLARAIAETGRDTLVIAAPPTTAADAAPREALLWSCLDGLRRGYRMHALADDAVFSIGKPACGWQSLAAAGVEVSTVSLVREHWQAHSAPTPELPLTLSALALAEASAASTWRLFPTAKALRN